VLGGERLYTTMKKGQMGSLKNIYANEIIRTKTPDHSFEHVGPETLLQSYHTSNTSGFLVGLLAK
jgi:hypothetical protein